ncbi:hypothetical protein LZK98_02500 [Sphingomonas cannabina]|uniref:hypothetical protein n=1 Tax=Sphingomonas cannabina TaxID=2899123 RepID=UPI001F3269A4|nr:hypothetical protein [Sphingomonas cannabina]UIJ45849.1 hypothetical protein LZK98_02500 [Sphingomonas cannabina]
MLSGVEARGRAAAERVRQRAVERVLAALGEMQGVRAEAVDEGVAVSGRGLRRRWLTDARLRWLGGWL